MPGPVGCNLPLVQRLSPNCGEDELRLPGRLPLPSGERGGVRGVEPLDRQRKWSQPRAARRPQFLPGFHTQHPRALTWPAAAHHRGMSRDTVAKLIRLPLGEEPIRPSFRRERAAMKRGVWPIAGCDEAGRGPLAGPVVAAAVILDPDRVPRGLEQFQEARPRGARAALRQDLRQRRGGGGVRAAVAHRPRQHPARVAVGARLRGQGAAGQAEAGLRRRARPHRRRLRLHGGDLTATPSSRRSPRRRSSPR